MLFVAFTIGLALVGLAAFIFGTISIARYAFRLSTAKGIASILFPP